MNNSQKEYISRINRVIDYIEQNIDKELSLEVLSKVALFSPFHFHRIFTVFVGETLNDFVKRKRVEKAARTLLYNPEDSISEVAYYCGYNSVQVFCRSFKKHYNVSAQEFRKIKEFEKSKIGQTQSKNGQLLPPSSDYVCNVESLKNKIMSNQIEIKEMPELLLASIKHVGEFYLIGEAYGRLMQWAGPRGLLADPNLKTVTVYHDDPNVTSIKNLRQSACITLSEPINTEGEISIIKVAAGKHAVGRFEISADGFKQAWDSMCLWMSESGFQPADSNPYELYHNNHEEHPEKKFILDICLPVKHL